MTINFGSAIFGGKTLSSPSNYLMQSARVARAFFYQVYEMYVQMPLL